MYIKVKYRGSGYVGTAEQDPGLEKAMLNKLPYPLACDLIGFICFFSKSAPEIQPKRPELHCYEKAGLTYAAKGVGDLCMGYFPRHRNIKLILTGLPAISSRAVEGTLPHS